jgi:hypothetical protein
MHYDTDSYSILVDNCCTRSITTSLNDYIDTPADTTIRIKGYNGIMAKPTKVGTVQWKWDVDTGKTHAFITPETYYSPDAETRLLLPQHWATSVGKDRATKCTTYHEAIVLK